MIVFLFVFPAKAGIQTGCKSIYNKIIGSYVNSVLNKYRN